MTELFRDAKDVLEAGKFVSGTGTNEPFGVHDRHDDDGRRRRRA
jgi:hypothetical protein